MVTLHSSAIASFRSLKFFELKRDLIIRLGEKLYNANLYGIAEGSTF
ncbi:hypothetical protein JOY44_22755 [Phormidium sp. CLA17]|nr:hypothetical protein [Leptolyngbya sp. Cla-17]MBM0744396.1 hypothetical protein [Leptolyngbya sp. Cla-17]